MRRRERRKDGVFLSAAKTALRQMSANQRFMERSRDFEGGEEEWNLAWLKRNRFCLVSSVQNCPPPLFIQPFSRLSFDRRRRRRQRWRETHTFPLNNEVENLEGLGRVSKENEETKRCRRDFLHRGRHSWTAEGIMHENGSLEPKKTHV
jgi:hypothetical protein